MANALLLTAALLAFAIGVAHSYLGEKYILVRLMRRDNLPRLFGSDWFTKPTLRWAWHATTPAGGGVVHRIPPLCRSKPWPFEAELR